MNKYEVSFTPTAEDEILEAYEWGVETWGQERAEAWLRALFKAVFERPSVLPKGCAIASESERLKREVRHYIFNRYRIIFEIRANNIVVLRLTGPFNSREVNIGLAE